MTGHDNGLELCEALRAKVEGNESFKWAGASDREQCYRALAELDGYWENMVPEAWLAIAVTQLGLLLRSSAQGQAAALLVQALSDRGLWDIMAIHPSCGIALQYMVRGAEVYRDYTGESLLPPVACTPEQETAYIYDALALSGMLPSVLTKINRH